jgi:mannose-1-phosphate guanylyltransferase
MVVEKEWMAVVLAGGVGKRLFPLTKEQPKPLVPVGNRPMIDYAIQLLVNAGIKKIIIVVKYLGEQIREWIEKNNFPGIEIYIPDVDSLDTADAVRKIEEYIDRDFIVTMADIVTNLDLRKAIGFHLKHDPLATICLKPVELPGQFGLTMIDNSSRIHLFLEKPTPLELLMTTFTFAARRDILHMHHNLANIGIYIFKKQMVAILKSYGDLMDFGKNVFPFLLDQKLDVRGYLSDPYWMDAGTIRKYIWANNDVARNWSFPYSPKGECRSNNIWIGDNLEIDKTAKIIGPAIIGDNCKIGKKSIIGPNATLGSSVNIGENCKIIQSVLLNDIFITNNVDITNSVLSNEVSIQKGLNLEKLAIPHKTVLEEIKNEYIWS